MLFQVIDEFRYHNADAEPSPRGRAINEESESLYDV